ncbi:MAG: hypothetical protein EBR82_62755 [Caulobacteraceae bacterium]|nr:hypothetical protein [Caulobacteraceae bacterium]
MTDNRDRARTCGWLALGFAVAASITYMVAASAALDDYRIGVIERPISNANVDAILARSPLTAMLLFFALLWFGAFCVAWATRKPSDSVNDQPSDPTASQASS